MDTMPVEFERACERRWVAKSGRPAASAPLYKVEQNDLGEPGSSSADFRPRREVLRERNKREP
jgi:hypothetical protein